MSQKADLAGTRFGRLVVVVRAGSNRHRKKLWRVLCDCGNETIVIGSDLRAGQTRSCGCLDRERLTTHGMTNSVEYAAWKSMIGRCMRPQNKNYKFYGARGVTICNHWLESFENFYADVGPRPSADHSLDRYPDNKGNYEPGNVRWATIQQQGRNKRSNRIINFQGHRMSLVEACELAGLSYRAVMARINRGWDVARALSIPVNKWRASALRDGAR